MDGASVSEEERAAIERFRQTVAEALSTNPMNNYYDRVHIFLYNNWTLVREWIEVSTVGEAQDVDENLERLAEVEEVQAQAEVQQPQMSQSLTQNMLNYIRSKTEINSMRCRIMNNGEWGLGLALLNSQDVIQFFLPLGRVRDNERNFEDTDEEHVSGTESDHDENRSQPSRAQSPVSNHQQENENNNSDDEDEDLGIFDYETDDSSEENRRQEARLTERMAGLYTIDNSFFKVIRTRKEYEKALPVEISPKIPMVASTQKYLILRSAHFKAAAALSRMAIAFPNMMQEYDRIATFEKHDGHVIKEITPEKYAEAGFFSYGEHDAVTCYFCGGTIANWLPNDDPWQYHAHFYPDCMYVYLKRGKNFIKLQYEKPQAITPYEPPKSVDDDKTRYECKICFVGEISVVFKPCEHMITCYDCAPKFQACPWCKSPIFEAVRCIITT